MSKKICFLCPGQGSQKPGMGRALLARSANAHKVFSLGSDICGTDLSALCAEADEDHLNRTENAQIALFAVAAAAHAYLAERGIHPDGTAGFSLGECSALYIAGVLTLPDAFRLVRERARLMQEVSDRGGGAMCAVLGIDVETIRALAQDSAAEPVNFNCPGQTVISGPRESVERLASLCREKGAKRTVPLSVSGAFHTAAMEPAARVLRETVKTFKTTVPRIPLYCNATALPLPPDFDLPGHLSVQMTSPVLWQQSMERCQADGFTLFYELGPGRTLSGFHKKICPESSCVTLDSLLEEGARL